MTSILRRLFRSHSTAVAYLALFAALGGSAYAAVTVTGKNIKDGTVTGRDVKNRSLGTNELSPTAVSSLKGQPGPAGPQGDKGAPGPTGPIGPAGCTSAGSKSSSSNVFAPPPRSFASSAPRCRSQPAQKWPCAPWNTATRASGSASKSTNARCNACAVSASTALRTSGRESVTKVTGPDFSTWTAASILVITP